MKRLTYDYIKSQFEKEGYTLLSKEYKNAHQKLDYICSKGHRHSIRWNSWQQGKRCLYCAKCAKKMIEEIREAFESEGYKLLTKEYRNSCQKLKYICPNGHKHSISWGAWLQGKRCPYCYGNIKKTFDEIREAFEAEGYTLLTKEYKNSKQKLEYICPNNHKHSISWNSFQHGYRCPYCAGLARKTIEEIRKSFESEGYKLLTREYKDCFQKLEYICPNGHRHSITWASWQQGHRCGKCQIKYYSKEELEKFNKYKEAVYNLTNRIYRKYKSYINPNNYRRGKHHHLDHIYSVIDGFENNVPIEIISNLNNLRMVPANENLSKNGNSNISKMLLYHLAIERKLDDKITK